MKSWKNSILIESILKALHTIASHHTSNRMNDEKIGSSIKTLENKYNFLKYVNIDGTKNIL